MKIKAVSKFIFLMVLAANFPVRAGSMPSPECKIELLEKTFIVGSALIPFPVEEFISQSTCPREVQKSFMELLSRSEGKVPTDHLELSLSGNFLGYKIQVFPEKVVVWQLNHLLRERLGLSFNQTLTQTKIIGPSQIITLNPGQGFHVECPNCHLYGEKNIGLTLFDDKNKFLKKYWISAQLKSKIPIFKANRDLPAFAEQELLTELSEDYLEVSDPENYFRDKDKVIFYRLNKPLKMNMPLKISDLTPLPLVKAGAKTKIHLSRGNLNITSQAIARSTGRFGDQILLINPISKREFQGKVTDFQTVMVDI